MEIQLTADRIYLAGGYTDVRKSIDGLSAVVSQQYDLNPLNNMWQMSCEK